MTRYQLWLAALALPTALGAVEGAATPEGVLQAVGELGDISGLVRLIAPDERASFTVTAVFGIRGALDRRAEAREAEGVTAEEQAARRSLEERFATILDRYELASLARDLPAAQAAIDFAVVDHATLIGELTALQASLFGEDPWPQFREDMSGEVRDVVVEEERATVSVGREPLELVRVDGRWFWSPRLESVEHIIQNEARLRTLARIRNLGTAIMSWWVDHAIHLSLGTGEPATLSNYEPRGRQDLEERLVPRYMAELPLLDGWGHPFDVYLMTEATRDAPFLVLIRSPGRDGVFQSDSYGPGVFDREDLDQDMVWADGEFVRRSR